MQIISSQAINFYNINYYISKYFITILIVTISMFFLNNAFAKSVDTKSVDTKSANTSSANTSSANNFPEREIYEAKDIPDIAFLNGKNEEIKLTSFKGKIIILNFWATWCGPCIEEMSAFDKLQKELGDDYIIIAVSEDFKGLEKVEQFYEDEKIVNLGKYADIKNRLMNSFKVKGLPTTILINKDMKEVARINGYANWLKPEVKEFITGL